MILGHVNDLMQPLLKISICRSEGEWAEIPAILDTGYTGDLLLSLDVIESLGLQSIGQIPAMLADGTMVLLPMYEGMVRWNDEVRTIVIDAADSHALIGMSLLKGVQLTIQAIPGGVVAIEPLQDSPPE